jgi:tetratricopeptide (TPR) repeat protein
MMNPMKRLIFAFFLIGIVFSSGCKLKQMMKMAKEQNLTVTPSPLEVHADTVSFEVSANLPAKMLKKDLVYAIDLEYQSNGQTVELERIEFVANDFPNRDEESPRMTKSFSFPYNEELGNGNLVAQGVGIVPASGKEATTDEMPVAEGLITTSQLVDKTVPVAYADHGYNTGEELVPTNVEFFFQQGSSYLRPSEMRSDRGDFLSAFVAEKNVTRTVSITGTHSPEGPERVNSSLAENRAQAIEKWYRDMMDRYDYKGSADEINFILKDVVEDWTEFKEMLADYDGISQEQKSQILEIVNGSGNFEQKEDALHRLPSYNKIFRDIYPKLRVAKTEILTVMDKKSEAEISVLSKQLSNGQVKQDTLSMEELLYGATLTPSISEKEAIYKAAIKKEDNWAAHASLGAVYLAQALEASDQSRKNDLMEQAMTQFEMANNMNENAATYVNMAIIDLMQGNSVKAQQTIASAEKMNPSNTVTQSLNAVKGVIQIHRAQYEEAIRSLARAEEGPVNLYNKGLAHILAKDYQNAQSALQDAIEMRNDYALAYYALAIANARMQNESELYDKLGRAIQLNPDLREQALNNLEFQNYSGSDQFRNAIR